MGDGVAFLGYLLAGALAGAMSGMLGVGGGIVVVPALVAIFSAKELIPASLQMPMAIGTSLAIMIITLSSSLYTHHNRQMVNWAIVRSTFSGLVVGIVLGAMLVRFLPSDDLRWLFSLFLLFVAVKLLFSRHPSHATSHRTAFAGPWMIAHSCVIGFLSSLFGVGGGTMWVPLFLHYGRPVHEAVGTAAACGVLTAVIASALLMLVEVFTPINVPLSTGFVYWPAFLGASMASVLVAPLGAALSYRLSGQWLKYTFALVMVLISVQMMFFNRV